MNTDNPYGDGLYYIHQHWKYQRNITCYCIDGIFRDVYGAMTHVQFFETEEEAHEAAYHIRLLMDVLEDDTDSRSMTIDVRKCTSIQDLHCHDGDGRRRIPYRYYDQRGHLEIAA